MENFVILIFTAALVFVTDRECLQGRKAVDMTLAPLASGPLNSIS